MHRTIPFMLIALLGACTTAPTDQERLQTNMEALPELAADIAERIDTVRMTVRAPEIGALPVDTTSSTSVVALAPCCSMKTTKLLRVLYETTWCQDPMADVSIDALPVAYRSTSDTGRVRHTKLTTLRGRRLSRPWWCHTSNGPWDAELVYDHNCQGGPVYYMTISTPGGLVFLPPWVGGEEYKPLEVTVLECTLLHTTKAPCSGLSTCNCFGSVCEQDCDCPVF